MINNVYAIVEQYMPRQTKDHPETINIVDFSILKVNTRKQNMRFSFKEEHILINQLYFITGLLILKYRNNL
jgi:hypothetical protein